MANIDKITASENFYNGYKELSDIKKKTFSALCNKLLKDNFIYGGIESDKTDYYSILNYRDLIESYFSMIDYNLLHDDNNKVFFIETSEDRNRIRLRKVDTILLLVLRLLYYTGQKQVTLSSNTSDVYVKTSDLIENINNTNIFSNDSYKTELMNSLKLLRRYKIVSFDFKQFTDDSIIAIYPTILQVVKSENINGLNDRLNSYLTEKGGAIDEVNED